MKKTIKIVFIIILIFLAVGVTFRVIKKLNPPKEQEPEKFRTPVIVTRINNLDLHESVEYIGEIEPDKIVNVFPKVPGKLIKTYVEEGDFIKQGKILATIDRDITGFKYKNFELESPSNGFIYKIHSDEGNNVYPQAPVFTIFQIDKVKVTFYIPEQDFVPGIQNKQVILNIPASEYTNSNLKIKKVFPVLDPITRSFKAQLILSNPKHHLKPGSYAKIKIIFNKKLNVLAVSKDSIIEFNNLKFVFVVEEGGTVKKTEITTGIQEGVFFEVLEGLTGDEKIISKGIHSVKDGDEVRIIKEEELNPE